MGRCAANIASTQDQLQKKRRPGDQQSQVSSAIVVFILMAHSFNNTVAAAGQKQVHPFEMYGLQHFAQQASMTQARGIRDCVLKLEL